MKSCPNCGAILEGKLKCDYGYDTLTGEVDEKIYEDFKNNEKVLYKQSCDNISMMGTANQHDIVAGIKMMGMATPTAIPMMMVTASTPMRKLVKNSSLVMNWIFSRAKSRR